jgi:drug/metabolite transporter (DMT)-like permease
MNTKAYLALAATVIVWGIAPAFVRSFSIAVGPWDSMFIRMTSVALLCLAFLPLSGAYIARKDWMRLLFVSWIGMFGYFLGSIFGFAYIKTGIGGILIAIQPLIVAILAAVLGTDRLTVPVIAGLLISFGGVLYLDIDKTSINSDEMFGVGMLLLCDIAFAMNIVFSRPLIQQYGAFRVTLWTMILAAIPALFFFRPDVAQVITSLPMNAWGELFYLGFIGTILVVVFWNYAVGILRPTTVGASLYAIPLLAALSGWLILDETLTMRTIIAGAVILAGVAISEFTGRTRSQ